MHASRPGPPLVLVAALATGGCYPQIDLSGVRSGKPGVGAVGAGGADSGDTQGGPGTDVTSELCTGHDDADGDGHGDPDTAREVPCDELGDTLVREGGDCDDSRPDIHPGAEERCDGVDNDCDGVTDGVDAVDAVVWYADVDGDGYGDESVQTRGCVAPTAYVGVTGDCDDFDPDVRPGAPEVCDERDNDCDGLSDDSDPDVDLADAPTWWNDADGDGHGAGAGFTACAASPSSSGTDGDCDDGDAAVHPGAAEVCNGQDDDCDVLVDDDDPDLDPSSASDWYVDADGDGYGDSAAVITRCVAPSGTVSDGTDCDDGDPGIRPSASEVCNGWDDDCDGLVDDDDSSLDLATRTTWYADSDGDGFGDASTALTQCSSPSGYTTDDTDCDDTEGSVNPDAVEICSDGIDNDCSGTVDDAAFCIEVDITSDATEVDLYALAGSPAGATSVFVTIASGVTVSSSSTGAAAMTTSGFDTGSLVIIENLGTIQGHGGDGACEYGGNGESGGDALEVTVDVELDTSAGGVYGGGGGGGAGDDPKGGGGGAGGGLGCDGGGNASGGVGGHGSRRFSSVPGGDGALYDGSLGIGGAWGSSPSGGSGGSGGSPGDGGCEQGQGGAGGGWGGGGGGGAACGASRNPGSGGDAGWAVRVLSGSITITGGHDTTHVKGWVG